MICHSEYAAFSFGYHLAPRVPVTYFTKQFLLSYSIVIWWPPSRRIVLECIDVFTGIAMSYLCVTEIN